MIFKTLRLRLIFIYTTAVSLIFILLVSFIYFQYRKVLLETVDADLLKTAKKESSGHFIPDSDRTVEVIKKVGDEFYKVITSQGMITIAHLESNQQWPLNRELMVTAFRGTPQFETTKYKDEDYRTLYFPVSEDTILRIGKSQESMEKAATRVRRLFLISFPVVFTISALLSWFLARKILDPITKIKLLAGQISQGLWDKRINIGSNGKEIDDLVEVLNDMIDNIQQSIESQKRFTSDVSHEIRSPLTSLRGNIEVVLRKKRTPEEYEDVLRNNLSDVIRLSRIIDNLLFLSRTNNKILDLRRQWFDIKHLLETVVEGFRYKAMTGGLAIIEEYQTDLELNGDIDLLEQAFSNIIDNAIKYTQRGGTTTIKTQEEDTAIKIMVSDTGIGIPEEEIQHIFERFYRVDKEHSKKSGGTGLGLAITHRIVKAHNGEIIVKSSVGKGSKFTIVLPKMPD